MGFYFSLSHCWRDRNPWTFKGEHVRYLDVRSEKEANSKWFKTYFIGPISISIFQIEKKRNGVDPLRFGCGGAGASTPVLATPPI